MLKAVAWYGLLSLALVACVASETVDRQSSESLDQLPADPSVEAARNEMRGLTMPQRIVAACALIEDLAGNFACEIDENGHIIRASTIEKSEPLANTFCSVMADVKSDSDTWRLVVTGADANDQHECQF